MSVAPQTSISPTEFDNCVAQRDTPGLYSAERIATVQVNIGLKCNLICRHCHVNSSPLREERMDWETMEAVLDLAEKLEAEVVDITGGAPEMHPDFRRFVEAARGQGHEVIVRTNLTILLEEGYRDLPEFFRDHGVHLVASLPCYQEENVDVQRGEGVYAGSIEVLQRLNALGYGNEPDLRLDLVFNPGGPVLPPDQHELETEYRRELKDRFGISFSHLHTITNVPIGRFRGDLQRGKRLEPYLTLLREAFNPRTVDALMCRHQISIGWDGTLFDCDFNLAIGCPSTIGESPKVQDVRPEDLLNRRIFTGDHCFACTAGAGSSCGGALV